MSDHARLYQTRLISGPDALGDLVVAECVRCAEDPARPGGHLVGSTDVAEVGRLMRNHLAQQHDILPSPRSQP